MNTTIYDQLRKLYDQCPDRSFEADIAYFLRKGYVFSSPTYLLIGQRMDLGWHIHCAIGQDAMQQFGRLMPYYLPFIGWAREAQGKSELIWHHTETVFRRIAMNLTPQQQFDSCRYKAASIVAQYRASAPENFDPLAMGGMPSPPKPPAPPTQNQAAQNILGPGSKRQPFGFDQTLTTKNLGNASSNQPNVKTLLGA